MGKVLCIQTAQTEQERKPGEKLGGKVMISSNKILYCARGGENDLFLCIILNAKHVEATFECLGMRIR